MPRDASNMQVKETVQYINYDSILFTNRSCRIWNFVLGTILYGHIYSNSGVKMNKCMRKVIFECCSKHFYNNGIGIV